MKKKFLPIFFKELFNVAVDMGEVFTLDFYLHRGRKHNLYYPDERKRFKKGLYNLKKQGYIKLSGKKSFRFTKNGKKWYQENSFKHSPLRENVWDGKWRVVFFDIPEELHTKRDIFRNRLKNLGFYQIQKSILVLPFKCESDIAELSSRLKISLFVDILLAYSIGTKEQELKKIFNL